MLLENKLASWGDLKTVSTMALRSFASSCCTLLMKIRRIIPSPLYYSATHRQVPMLRPALRIRFCSARGEESFPLCALANPHVHFRYSPCQLCLYSMFWSSLFIPAPLRVIAVCCQWGPTLNAPRGKRYCDMEPSTPPSYMLLDLILSKSR